MKNLKRVGLIPSWIITRDDLNRAELANIAAGLRWVRRGRFDILDADSLFTQHKRMFGDVWRWAGTPRASEKNIGVADWWNVREHLHVLLGDIAHQIAAGAQPAEEIAVGFHHRLVSIHVLPNGNGRHARLAADLRAERLGREPFTWGRTDLGPRRRHAGRQYRRHQVGGRLRPRPPPRTRPVLRRGRTRADSA